MARVNIDLYLGKSFNLLTYNCWHMLEEVWRDLTGEELGDRTPGRMVVAALMGSFDAEIPLFEELDEPAEPSILLLTRKGAVPHVGAHFGGRVLQMSSSGPSYMTLGIVCRGFERVRHFR